MAHQQAQYLILQFAEPGGHLQNIGVLLYVPADNRLYCQFRDKWTEFQEESVEVLRELVDDFAAKAVEMGGSEVLRYLEDNLSNPLQVTERKPVTIARSPADPDEVFPELDQLFRTHVKA